MWWWLGCDDGDKRAAACEPAAEIVGDGLDQDCDGADLLDADGDGHAADTDCDDGDPAVHPGSVEVAGDGRDLDCDGADPTAAWTGAGADAGFGASLAARSGADPLIGAPWWGDTLSGRAHLGAIELRSGDSQDRLGASLLVVGDTLLLGAPGSGRVLDGDGQVRLTGAGVGRALAGSGARWVTSDATGARWSDGATVVLGAPADRLAVLTDGTLVAGFVRGDVALSVGGRDVPRPAVGDEAGYALLVADVTGDGAEDLVVGAPGSDTVYLLDPAAPGFTGARAWTGEGRFGAALAFAGGRLWVGAPMAGALAHGALYAVEGEVAAVALTGSEGSQLGFALAADGERLLVGAPGPRGAAGAVYALDVVGAE